MTVEDNQTNSIWDDREWEAPLDSCRPHPPSRKSEDINRRVGELTQRALRQSSSRPSSSHFSDTAIPIRPPSPRQSGILLPKDTNDVWDQGPVIFCNSGINADGVITESKTTVDYRDEDQVINNIEGQSGFKLLKRQKSKRNLPTINTRGKSAFDKLRGKSSTKSKLQSPSSTTVITTTTMELKNTVSGDTKNTISPIITLTPPDEEFKKQQQEGWSGFQRLYEDITISVPGVLDEFWGINIGSYYKDTLTSLGSEFNQTIKRSENDLREQMKLCEFTQNQQRLMYLTVGSKLHGLKNCLSSKLDNSIWQFESSNSNSNTSSKGNKKELYEFKFPQEESIIPLSNYLFRIACEKKANKTISDQILSSIINESCICEGTEVYNRLKELRDKVDSYDLKSPYQCTNNPRNQDENNNKISSTSRPSDISEDQNFSMVVEEETLDPQLKRQLGSCKGLQLVLDSLLTRDSRLHKDLQ